MSLVLKPFYTILDTKRDFWHREFQTRLDARPACTDVNTETSKYGRSCRCSQIQLLCSFRIKSRAEGDPGTSQLAREKSLWAWMHSNATPQYSPGRSSFTTSRAKRIILITVWITPHQPQCLDYHFLRHLCARVCFALCGLNPVCAISISFPALYHHGRPVATDLPLYRLLCLLSDVNSSPKEK